MLLFLMIRNSPKKLKPLILKSVTGLNIKAKNMRSLTYTAFILLTFGYLNPAEIVSLGKKIVYQVIKSVHGITSQ